MGISSKERKVVADIEVGFDALPEVADEATSGARTDWNYAEGVGAPRTISLDVEMGAAVPASDQPLLNTMPTEGNYSVDQALIGRKVEAKVPALGDAYYPGTIADVHFGGTFDVQFDSGSKEMFVPRTHIKLL